MDNTSFKIVAAVISNLKVRTYSHYKTDVKSKFPINNKSHGTVYPGYIMFLVIPPFFVRLEPFQKFNGQCVGEMA